ncbi:MAG: MFS transporter [Tabrizicola sp.]|nr:MFS transporter [Tabrizicola sp.]
MVRAEDDLKADQRALIWGTLNGSLARDVTLGTFVVAYAVQVLGYSNGQISWFLSLVPLAVLLRYPFLDRIRSVPRIDVLRASRSVHILCILLLMLIPAEWMSLPLLGFIALLFVFGNEFLQNAVWMNMVAEVTTRAERGRFLGRLRTVKQATNMSFALFGFFLVGETLSQGEYRILLLVILALLVNSAWWYRGITRRPVNEAAESGKGQFWAILRRHPMMRGPMLIAVATGVAQWPILIVFLVGSLHVPADLLMLTVVAGMIGSIFSEWLWGAAADRFGLRRILAFYFIGSILICPLLFLIPDFSDPAVQGQSWFAGALFLLVFSLLRGTLEAGRLMADTLYKASLVRNAGGFHAVNLLTAANQLFVAGLTATGGLILAAVSDGTGALEAVVRRDLLWIDDFRLITTALITLACVIGLWLSRKLRFD